jgi:hypothetical protein
MKIIIALIITGCFVPCASGVFAADRTWQLVSADGESSIAVGILAQAQVERIRTTTHAADSQDIFLRRFRLITSGKFSSKFSFFIDTDSPNLAKGTAAGTKIEERMYLQDAVFTYSFRPQLQIDAGMLLVALSHNSCQSAASLLPLDYGPYSFVASEATSSRVGRDYGIQARGYLYKRHFEYRAGVFQGSRATPPDASIPGTRNDFRYTGRFVWYPFDPELGYFYTGTSLGERKILSLGIAFDHQMNYSARSVDVFFDQPLPRGDGITVQAGYSYYDGGKTFPQLKREHIWLVEAGYFNKTARLGPFAQLSSRLYSDPQTSDTKKYLGGIAYWPSGHRFNIKLGIGRSLGSVSAESWQAVVQGQAYVH